MTAPVAERAEERGQGICRTCLRPIWKEGGTVGHRQRETGWSDRLGHSGDSLVCFKAAEYRHVPLTGREACVYDDAFARGGESAGRLLAAIRAVVEETMVFTEDDMFFTGTDDVVERIWDLLNPPPPEVTEHRCIPFVVSPAPAEPGEAGR